MKLLGTIGEGENIQNVYAFWDGEQVKYIVDNEEVAVYNPAIMENPILFMQNTKANDLSSQAKEQITALAEEIDLEELQKLEVYAKNVADSLDIETDDIESITEIELKQEIKEDEDEALSEEKKEEKEKKKDKDKDKKEEIEYTTKDINIKQEVKLNAMATDMKTVGGVLKRAGKMPQVEGKTFSKLGIVESSSMKNIDAKVNSTRFSFVAIATDGTVVPINLEQDYAEGNNPTEISYEVNTDGTVEQDNVESQYRIGNSGETLSVKQPKIGGNIEVGYSRNKTASGNKRMDTELETRNTYYRPNRDVRPKEYGGRYSADDSYKEAVNESKTDKPELKEGKMGEAKGVTYKDIDGKENTKSHEHHDEEEEEEGRVPWDENRKRY